MINDSHDDSESFVDDREAKNNYYKEVKIILNALLANR